MNNEVRDKKDHFYRIYFELDYDCPLLHSFFFPFRVKQRQKKKKKKHMPSEKTSRENMSFFSSLDKLG